MPARLVQHWVYGGFLAGLLLLALTPVLAWDWPIALTCIFLAMPVYMLHQFEEHDDDRFHREVTRLIGKGRDVLPSPAIFVINVPLVWGLNAISFALGAQDLGWGLIALYTMVANVFVHVMPALITRRYNPGLATALIFFLPLGLFGTWQIMASTSVTALQHGVALALAIGAHLAIVGYALANRRLLTASGPIS